MESYEYAAKGELISFFAEDRLRLAGFLMRGGRRRRCVIYLHGLGSNLTTQTAYLLAPYFNSAGFATFVTNTRGSGAVTGMFRMRNGKRVRIVGGTNYEVFEDSWKDVGGAIDTLYRKGFREFVLCGHSTGCQKAAYYQYKTRDRRVKGLILLAPADDYDILRRDLGKNFKPVAAAAAGLIRRGKKNDLVPGSGTYFSAQRLDSQLNLKRIEARLFNYNGPLNEFGRIWVPIYATFGTKEEYATKNVRICLELLGKRTSSTSFTSKVIIGADHHFNGKVAPLGKSLKAWLKILG